ncbi:diaminopimelate epimerase [candidate division KSB3 bacterium]|uniref:Diaminopimelate epimerase n=1 Tax=candidate division KSB3 bacterium TaxID=2044937 RepID=A0A9D5Q6B0_9BACT|nr:diaminopimelate epimerase [candidate division KSB3 bacterium]MBD3324736.1 diaminopimelate epimerase [candidate division KSB3 bacterium]
MRFWKYHGLGNDYLVMHPADLQADLTPSQIRLICHPHYGVGADGLMIGPIAVPDADFGLRLFNPDGGAFEKSGNGLRIFARYLWDLSLVQAAPFTIATPGGRITAQVDPEGKRATVEMGTVSFDSRDIPVTGPPRAVLNETLLLQGREFRFCAATIGNPHCVVFCDEISAENACTWGPLIETDPRFPNRTNVQFLHILDRSHIRIEIWERGVGYTLASGSSSCAAAAVAHKLGFCDPHILVTMPGGSLEIQIAANFAITMTGAVTKICEGRLAREMFSEKTHLID